MEDYFEKNRYNFSKLIDKIKAMKEVPNIIIDEETDIEIYEGNKISKDILISILKEFNLLDNLVQDECKNEYEQSNLNIICYQFAPGWIKVSDNEITIGYWGIEVNSNFDKTFIKQDGSWIMK